MGVKDKDPVVVVSVKELMMSLSWHWQHGESANKADHLFYIYEDEDWPAIATASMYKRDPNERLDNQLHHGAGPVVEARYGEYHTDQYQLYAMLYHRSLKDPRRTLDPAQATSFLIPYDFASDSAFYKNCARSTGVCYDFRKCPLAPAVERLLARSPYFQRKQGRDHVLIVGMNYAMDHYSLKPECKSHLSRACANCTKFAIDDYSFMYATDAGIVNRGDHWHAIPFPADFHWSHQKSFYGPLRRLRQSIAHFCSLHPQHCLHQSYGLNSTRFNHKVDGHRLLQGHYLCTGLDLFLTIEPNLFAAMALVHSRIRRVYFLECDPVFGALKSGNGHLHSLRSLNHYYRVFQVSLRETRNRDFCLV
eukprot:gene3017-3291_t